MSEASPKSTLTNQDKQFIETWEKHPMRRPRILKVTVNFAVGESGKELEKARTLCEQLTGQKPVECYAKQTIRSWGIRKGEPIGVRVTLRGTKAKDFLGKVIWAKNDKIQKKNFDKFGNVSLGIKEHLDLPDTRYNPKIGVLGFGVSVTLERPGFSIKRRRYRRRKIPENHKMTKAESIAFFKTEFDVTIE